MAIKIHSAAVIGLNCELVEVEADVVNGLPKFFIVGLPDMAVSESKQRVRSAFKNSMLKWPRGAITVNLAPADLKKEGPAYDLPIALSILAANGILSASAREGLAVFAGELALDGHLRPINGVLSMALMARDKKVGRLFVPAQNAEEASLVEEIEIFGVSDLRQMIDHLNGIQTMDSYKRKGTYAKNEPKMDKFDMAFIQGQEHVKRALEIAAAGEHNILMSGPPGSGKTMLARTVPTILPEMTKDEILEVTRIYSVCGLLPSGQPLIQIRPFRSPHHTASGASLVGGGAWPKPGEISLAHRGVLFLDEFPEFPRIILDYLRQPLEDGVINISRVAGSLQFPAKFILLASMNPCPCGYYGDDQKNCVCSQTQILNYQRKISGPLMDRIDMHVEVPKINFDKLAEKNNGETSEKIRARVNRARELQHLRFVNSPNITNAEMTSEQVKKICPVDENAQSLLKQAVNKLYLSARGYYRILKLARTIADLEESDQIATEHVAEALQYRPKIG